MSIQINTVGLNIVCTFVADSFFENGLGISPVKNKNVTFCKMLQHRTQTMFQLVNQICLTDKKALRFRRFIVSIRDSLGSVLKCLGVNRCGDLVSRRERNSKCLLHNHFIRCNISCAWKILALHSLFSTSYCTERIDCILRTHENRHAKPHLADSVSPSSEANNKKIKNVI